jgi:segregation and condensation protein B
MSAVDADREPTVTVADRAVRANLFSMMEIQQIKRIVEAALLAAGQPLSLAQLSALFSEQEAPSHEDLARAIEELTADAAERGIELKEVASGFRYQVRQDVHAWVARLWTERQTKYSRALLETLALIAYRQPITRGEIEQIRGVAVSTNIIKTLEEREWVRVVGYRDVPGKPALFGTTRNFLDYFNLKSLEELPPLAEIREIEDFDPQLNLAPVAAAEAEELQAAEDQAAEPHEGATPAQAEANDAFATGVELEPHPTDTAATAESPTQPAAEGEAETEHAASSPDAAPESSA